MIRFLQKVSSNYCREKVKYNLLSCGQSSSGGVCNVMLKICQACDLILGEIEVDNDLNNEYRNL